MVSVMSDDEVIAWIESISALPSEDRNLAIREMGDLLSSEAWELVWDVFHETFNAQTEYWVVFRAWGKRRVPLDLAPDEDFETLKCLYDAAGSDEERFFAVEESFWGVNLIESDETGEVLRWFTSRIFDEPHWQARYLCAFLSCGYVDSWAFQISDTDVSQYVARFVGRVDEFKQGRLPPPDFVTEALPGTLLVHYALLDGRSDMWTRIGKLSSRGEMRELRQLYGTSSVVKASGWWPHG